MKNYSFVISATHGKPPTRRPAECLVRPDSLKLRLIFPLPFFNTCITLFQMKCRVHEYEGVAYLIISCAGCGSGHALPHFRPVTSTGPTWSWNGNVELPTVSPSVRTNYRGPEDPPGAARSICHFTLINGIQHFHSDDSILPNRDEPLRELEH